MFLVVHFVLSITETITAVMTQDRVNDANEIVE